MELVYFSDDFFFIKGIKSMARQSLSIGQDFHYINNLMDFRNFMAYYTDNHEHKIFVFAFRNLSLVYESIALSAGLKNTVLVMDSLRLNYPLFYCKRLILSKSAFVSYLSRIADLMIYHCHKVLKLKLTLREEQVARLYIKGFTPLYIAKRLNLSVKTVSFYKQSLSSRIGLANFSNFLFIKAINALLIILNLSRESSNASKLSITKIQGSKNFPVHVCPEGV